MISNKKLIIFGFLLIFSVLSISGVSAATISTTDINGNLKSDFSPEEIVYIHGSGFSGNVLILVTWPNSYVGLGAVNADLSGNFVYQYDLDGIVGSYSIYASDGLNNQASTFFTDAAIWTTKDDCGASNQDTNQYNINDSVYINGDGFDSGNYSWDITGKPGGASCDPNIIVASGTKSVNSSGTFCFNAYTVLSNDCGEYQVKFGVKGDNYRVEGNTCTNNSQCGTPSSELSCSGNNTTNTTTIPVCISRTCNSTTTIISNNCGADYCNSLGNTYCKLGDVYRNQTCFDKGCASGACFNNSFLNETKVQDCANSCNTGVCTNLTICGNGILEANEQCENKSTINNSYCNQTISICNQTKLGTRDLFGNCNSSCSCIYDNFVYSCVKDQCGAQCSVDADCPKTICENKCIGKDYYQYQETNNKCLTNCGCEKNECKILNITKNDPKCDISKFCEQFYCSLDCFKADWNNDENSTYPEDCTVVLVLKEGDYYPKCVPLICSA